MTETRRLIVMRHSKTEHHATTDHARQLTMRGERDAGAAGRWLADRELVPQVILVSSAARAQETAKALVEGLGGGHQPELRVLGELYDASPSDALQAAATLEPEVSCAAVIGHNPTMAAAAAQLSSESDHDFGRFPTSALAVFEVDGSWAEIGAGAGSLVAHYLPDEVRS